MWFDTPVLSTSLRLPFDRLRANGMFTIVVSLSNHKLRMNGVEGLTMTGFVTHHISRLFARPEVVPRQYLSSVPQHSIRSYSLFHLVWQSGNHKGSRHGDPRTANTEETEAGSELLPEAGEKAFRT